VATRPYAERVGLQVELADELERELTVKADARRIGQVLTNLLANAVKFTPPGGRIQAGAARASNGWVEFWVADTGVGIPRDQLVRVFERFYKTDLSRTGAGTGLGLAICKHLVQAHGGSIWADSGPLPSRAPSCRTATTWTCSIGRDVHDRGNGSRTVPRGAVRGDAHQP
jgi:two-component system phosphate regulon sensor histidine kinase PhoR